MLCWIMLRFSWIALCEFLSSSLVYLKWTRNVWWQQRVRVFNSLNSVNNNTHTHTHTCEYYYISRLICGSAAWDLCRNPSFWFHLLKSVIKIKSKGQKHSHEVWFHQHRATNSVKMFPLLSSCKLSTLTLRHLCNKNTWINTNTYKKNIFWSIWDIWTFS